MIRAGLLPRVSVLAVFVLAGCGAPVVENPSAMLSSKGESPRKYEAAMVALDATPDDPAYLEQLHRMIWVAGYTVETREAALDRLARHDLEKLHRTIRNRLPQMNMPKWRGRVCEIIAERGWVDLTPALVSSWSQVALGGIDPYDRPEYPALVALHGEGSVVDVVFNEMITTNKVWQQGYRTRCWTLLFDLGARDRLVALLDSADVAPDDAMFIDLRKASVDLGIVPRNREEILWVRSLCKPEHAEFWSQAVVAVGGLSPTRQAMLDIRDIAVVVSASLHAPELLEMSETAMYAQLDAYLKTQKRYVRGSRFDSTHGASQKLSDYEEVLTWGDLAAMLIAIRALQVPEIVAHLFDYAKRDHLDTGTEYGGVIDLDHKGRFEILEFPPKVRQHDERYNAPQALFDAAYTALFHFHYHVQRERNEDHAGPGFGDRNYADATRANCLVLTSVGRGRLNVDFYRYGGVVVDLGVVESASGSG